MKRELQAERADTQAEMDEWVGDFNNLRPHQALNGKTSSKLYRRSFREYTGSLVEFDYKGLETRKIDKHGDLKWHSMDYLLSEALRGARVGMKSLGRKWYEVWFCEYLPGIVDENEKTFSPALGKGGKPRAIKGSLQAESGDQGV